MKGYRVKIKYFDGTTSTFTGKSFDDAVADARKTAESRLKNDVGFKSKYDSRVNPNAKLFRVISQKEVYIGHVIV